MTTTRRYVDEPVKTGKALRPQEAVEYTMGRTATETGRLMQQAELVQSFTRHLLEDAGIGSGMKVLDLGTGAGDVAMLAARLVGPTGAVVGLDTNPAVLAVARDRCRAAGLAQITFVEGDLRTAAVDDDFDAVVGRYVLLYVPDPVEALRTLARHVRPGGVLAFQEVEMSMVQAYLQHAGFPDLAVTTFSWAVEAFRRSGANPSMGFALYQAFQEAGLGIPQMAHHAMLGGPPDWPGFEMTAELFRSILPLLEQYGIATAQDVDVETLADRYRAMIAELGHPFIATPCVTAWGRVASARPLGA